MKPKQQNPYARNLKRYEDYIAQKEWAKFELHKLSKTTQHYKLIDLIPDRHIFKVWFTNDKYRNFVSNYEDTQKAFDQVFSLFPDALFIEKEISTLDKNFY